METRKRKIQTECQKEAWDEKREGIKTDGGPKKGR